jgi:hypothetical protein
MIRLAARQHLNRGNLEVVAVVDILQIFIRVDSVTAMKNLLGLKIYLITSSLEQIYHVAIDKDSKMYTKGKDKLLDSNSKENSVNNNFLASLDRFY